MADSITTPLDQTPGLLPPPGQSTDFNAYNELYQILIGTVTVCIFLTTAAIGARLILRARVDRRLKLEDCEYSLFTSMSSCLPLLY